MASSPPTSHRLSIQNRKARHEYFIEETVEAGIMLVGSEVKSIREGKANIMDSHAGEMQGELYLFNAHIAEYPGANRFNHEPRRPRKLLIHKKQRNKLLGKVQTKGFTLIALSMYFNEQNKVKVELALVRGKKAYDKRATEKERDWNREKARVLRNDD